MKLDPARIFRVVFGSYLLVHLAQLVPWGRELFSSEGVLPAAASPLLRLFPNVLAWSDAPATVTALLGVGMVAALLFLLGKWDRPAAIVVWYVWACLFGRNPLISNPSIPYVGLLLWAHALAPSGRGQIQAVVWALMVLGYSFSGYTKLVSPSWLDGSALARVLESPLARPGFVGEALRALPSPILVAASYGVLGLELCAAPLALWPRARPWLWSAFLLMHLGLVAVIDFADLSLGMVMLHLFTIAPLVERSAARARPVQAPTAAPRRALASTER